MFDRDTCWRVFQDLAEERQKDLVQMAVDLLVRETFNYFMIGGSLEDLLRD